MLGASAMESPDHLRGVRSDVVRSRVQTRRSRHDPREALGFARGVEQERTPEGPERVEMPEDLELLVDLRMVVGRRVDDAEVRIDDELLDTRSTHDTDSFVSMQSDGLSPVARTMVPLMVQVEPANEADRALGEFDL